MKKLMVFGVSLFLLLMGLAFVSAEDVEVTYPSDVNSGEVFTVTVNLLNFSLDIYDIKIEILNNDTQESIDAGIIDGNSWHDTFNYVNEAIDTSENNESIFSLNITDTYDGNAVMEVKVRDSSNNTQTFSGYELTVSYEEPPAEEPDPEIELKLDWEIEDIINGDTFKIEVQGLNLRDEYYDIKAYIYDDDDKNKPISETKNENDDWVSSTEYYEEFFQGPGKETEYITLRIKDDYEDLSGEFKIGVKIRETGESDILEEETEDIEVLEEEIKTPGPEPEEPEENNTETEEDPEPGTVRLGRNGNNTNETDEEENENESKIVYESSSEKMKKYAIYVLNALLIIIIIFLIKNKV